MKYAFIHFSFLLHFLIHMCMVTDIQHGSLVGFECKFKSFERKFEPFKCKFEPFEWKFEEFKCKFEPFKRKFEPFECKFYLSNGNLNHSNGNSQPSLFHSFTTIYRHLLHTSKSREHILHDWYLSFVFSKF